MPGEIKKARDYPRLVFLRKSLRLSESCLSLLYERCEACCIRDCDLGKNFTVELDAGLLKSVHEPGIAHVVETASGIDTNDPKPSEVSLLVSSVTVSIVAGLENLLISYLEKLALMAPVTLGSLKDLMMTSPCTDSSFYS